jgi:hypothetical protein
MIRSNIHLTSGRSSNSILRNEDASALVTIPDIVSSSDNQSSRLALAIGLPIGVLGLGCIVLLLILYRRKWRRRPFPNLTQSLHQWQILRSDPSPPTRQKREQPELRPTSSALHISPVSTRSTHVESLGLPEMSDTSVPPPYEDYLQANGASEPPTLKQ